MDWIQSLNATNAIIISFISFLKVMREIMPKTFLLMHSIPKPIYGISFENHWFDLSLILEAQITLIHKRSVHYSVWLQSACQKKFQKTYCHCDCVHCNLIYPACIWQPSLFSVQPKNINIVDHIQSFNSSKVSFEII